MLGSVVDDVAVLLAVLVDALAEVPDDALAFWDPPPP